MRSIIALTREIGLEVTADGVETGAQADALMAATIATAPQNITRIAPRAIGAPPIAADPAGTHARVLEFLGVPLTLADTSATGVTISDAAASLNSNGIILAGTGAKTSWTLA